jgi:hypothetical protein
MPAELVLDGYESHHPNYLEMDYPGGGKLIVEQISLTEGRLIRLISSRHEDYLNAKLQPGAKITFSPAQN